MASGVNHIKATIVLAVPAGAVAAMGGAGLWGVLACSAGCAAGIVLSPDLDLERRTQSEYLVYRFLGRFLGAVWFAFWYLYARLLPHRSPLSHWPVIGTLGRLIYVYLLGGILWYGATAVLTGSPHWLPLGDWLQNAQFSWALVGLALADALHYLMDWLPFWR